MVMIFSIKKVRDRLLSGNQTITFRARRRKRIGLDWMTDKRGGNKICNILIDEHCKVENDTSETITGMSFYTDLSGFDTFEEWKNIIFKLNNTNKLDGYLYLVSKI